MASNNNKWQYVMILIFILTHTLHHSKAIKQPFHLLRPVTMATTKPRPNTHLVHHVKVLSHKQVQQVQQRSSVHFGMSYICLPVLS